MFLPLGEAGGGSLDLSIMRKQHYSRPSPFGEGMGVRLVVDGGEAFCKRLNISKNEESRQRETTELTPSI